MIQPERYWASRNPLALLLLPLSWLFCLLATLRRALYRTSVIKSVRLPVPVIVVGNITVGGTGKTPLIIKLVDLLRKQGYTPGVISRGYGGSAEVWPQQVTATSDPALVGDEPVLIARRTGCPIWVGPDRPAVAGRLLDQTNCDILLSDDGMQHYALERDVEIAVIDGQRGLGNGFCLPAGPLREPPERLSEVDFVVVNGEVTARDSADEFGMKLVGERAQSLAEPEQVISLSDVKESGETIHAVAGIGNPDRFFTSLKSRGLRLDEHPFPDHHRFKLDDIQFEDSNRVLMTEKDGVKCQPFANKLHWSVPVDAVLESGFEKRLIERLRELKNG